MSTGNISHCSHTETKQNEIKDVISGKYFMKVDNRHILTTTNVSCTELALLNKNIETNLVEINREEMVLYGDFVPGDFSGVEEFTLILQRK